MKKSICTNTNYYLHWPRIDLIESRTKPGEMQAFSCRLKVERGVFANVIFLALDPVFVRRVAEGLELDSDRIELIEQRRSTDPTLHHIAMALRAGVQSGAVDRMYEGGIINRARR